MKIKLKTILIFLLSATIFFGCFGCEKKEETLRFSAPEGTPALCMLRLPAVNGTIGDKTMEYAVVNPSNIAAEMTSQKSDVIIMPVNAGAKLITQGAPYKMVGIAVYGSLYMVGRTQNGGKIAIKDIVGKEIACIGQTGVPGLVFRYVMGKNGINILTEGSPKSGNNEVLVRYVADGAAAKVLLANGNVDFAVVGEPAATAFLSAKPLNLNATMNMQEAYADATGRQADNYPQAGIFMKTNLVGNEAFLSAFFAALYENKKWIEENKNSVDAFAKENLYESAFFPSESLDNCALCCERLTEKQKDETIVFLKTMLPGIAWENYINSIF